MAALVAKIFGATTLLSASSAAAYTWQVREQNVAHRRVELATELEQLNAQIQATEASAQLEAAAMREEKALAADRLHVLVTLSADRQQRYDAALDYCRSAIEAIPKGAEVLADLADHYKHMARHMPAFTEFDALASRVHATSLLAAAASTARGIDGVHDGSNACSARRNRDVFKSMNRDDATMDLVLRTLDTSDPSDVPKSYAELSTAFAKSRRYLTEALDNYNARATEANKKRETLEAKATGAHVPFQAGTASAALRASLDVLRIEDDAAEHPSVAQTKAREAEMAQYQLKDRDSVLAALIHHHELKATLAKVGGSASDATWTSDPHVQRAIAALDVWAVGAQRFLADEQAHRIFRAFSSVMQHSLTAVDVPPPSASNRSAHR